MLRFSLIVCSRGRPVLLERMLLGVALLRYPEFELIVICDPSDPATIACLARHAPRARLGACGAANLAQARNVGLSMARGDIAAFLDDDAVPEPDWLDQLARAYTGMDVTAAGGFIRGKNGVNFQYRAVLIDEFGADHRRSQVPRRVPPGWFVSLTGTNFSVRLAAALAIGGFDENLPYFLEETDFLLRLHRAGGRISLAAGAQVHHGYAENSVRDEHGVPKSLHAIARSKAYFAHINRRPETPVADLARALKTFLGQKRRRMAAHLRAGRLGAARAGQLNAELLTGLAEGEALARLGRRLPASLTADEQDFESYLPREGHTYRRRLCVLADAAPPDWPPALSDAEVTVIYFGNNMRHRVSFSAGIWAHQLPMIWRFVPGGSQYAMAREIARILPRRCFDDIHVVSETRSKDFFFCKKRSKKTFAPGLPGV